MNRKTPLALVVALFMSACASDPVDQQPEGLVQPEQATGLQERPGWVYQDFAVAAANPLAAEAGKQMLLQGGNAVDAAIAAQLVLGLVEPQSSGLGGGGFLLAWDGDELIAWDGRETAPAAATPELFLTEEGKPLEFMQAVGSGAAVGVPGLLAMLEAAHQRQGQLEWAQLFEPAIQLAEQGFAVSERLHQLLAADPLLSQNSAAAAFYYPEGKPLAVGKQLTNPALAAIYRQLAQEGASAFYQGEIAESILSVANQAPSPASRLTLDDLSSYQPLAREALCALWLEYLVCGMPPPSSGHLTLMQQLGILQHLGRIEVERQDSFAKAKGVHFYLEAAKLAFADRALYIADPDFVDPPAGSWSSLLDSAYLAERAEKVTPVALEGVQAGHPAGHLSYWAPQVEQPEYGTTHISVLDAEGRGVALTSSIEQAFGSRLLVDGGTGLPGGFLLNNQLTDFSFRPYNQQGQLIANRVEAGKRPRSSMSPTLVFNPHSEELVASLGSPGGAAIIYYTSKTLLGMLQWQLAPQEAIELPNVALFNDQVLLEKDRFDDFLLMSLEARGHRVRETDLTSGIQALLLTPQGLLGGADPRREGWVKGK